MLFAFEECSVGSNRTHEPEASNGMEVKGIDNFEYHITEQARPDLIKKIKWNKILSLADK